MGNIRAAVRELVTTGDAERAAQMVGELRWYFRLSYRFQDGWLLTKLVGTRSDLSFGARAALALCEGSLALNQGEMDLARERLEAASADAQGIDRPLLEGRARAELAWTLSYLGHPADAEREFLRCEELAQQAGGNALLLWEARSGRAALAYRERDFASARRLTEETVTIAAGAGLVQEAHSLSNLGELELAEGRTAEAIVLFERGLAAAQELGYENARVGCLVNIAIGRSAIGDHRGAAEAAGLALPALVRERRLHELIPCLLVAAGIAGASGAPAAAGQLLGAAQEIRRRMGVEPWPTDQLMEERVRAAGSAPGAPVFDDAVAQGGALSIDDAVALAQAELSV
jgi:tetratricopeptide (TPR) repeat protein